MHPDWSEHRTFGPGAVEWQQDVPYGDDASQRMDVYRSPGARDAGVLVVVHGGAWALGDKANPGVVRGKLSRWLPLGCVIVSVNYRLLPTAGPGEQADDVARALAMVQRDAASWGGDPGRVALIGHSTGAHLAALVHADRVRRDRLGVVGWRGTVLLDSAALDVPQIMAMPHPRLYDRAFGRDPVSWPDVSPWHRLSGATSPLLLVCGHERPAAGQQADRFAARARELGGVASVLRVELAHAAINQLLGVDRVLTQGVEQFLESIGVLLGTPRAGVAFRGYSPTTARDDPPKL